MEKSNKKTLKVRLTYEDIVSGKKVVDFGDVTYLSDAYFKVLTAGLNNNFKVTMRKPWDYIVEESASKQELEKALEENE